MLHPILALMLTLCAPNQCPGGVCPTPPAAPSYAWHQRADDPGRFYLLRDGVLVGGYDPASGWYLAFENGTWGNPADPPVTVPKPSTARDRNFGIDVAKVQEAKAQKSAGSESGEPLADDRPLLRLTIAGGSDEDRLRVVKDLASAPALAPWQGKLLVQSYAADAPALTGVGLTAPGRPTILVQAPPDSNGRGVVLHRQDDYDGPDRLAAALRRADHSYAAGRDPDLRNTPNAALEWLKAPGPLGYPNFVWLLVFFALCVQIRRK